MLTWEELVAIGRRQGVVQWTHSRRIELLSLDAAGQLVASTMLSPHRAHVMLNVYARYYCRELTRSDLVTVGDLLA